MMIETVGSERIERSTLAGSTGKIARANLINRWQVDARATPQCETSFNNAFALSPLVNRN
jgi:hypothetical protein